MKSLIIIFICSTILLSCMKTEKKEPIANVFKNYYEESLKLFPINATAIGDNRYNDIFPNYASQSFKNELKTFYLKYQDILKQYEQDELSIDEKTSLEILKWEIQIGLGEQEFPLELLPFNQIFSTHLMVGQLASGESMQPFKTVVDYENWLKRVDGFITYCDTAHQNMKKGIEQKIVLPKTLIVKVIPQFESFANENIEEHLFYQPVKKFPDTFTDDEKKKLTDAYTDMVKNKVVPTFKKLKSFMENEYLNAGRTTSGIGTEPQGPQIYNHFIKYYTTTDLTADKIFELGQNEVKRISEEMEKVKNEVGFKGDLKAFFEYVRNKKELMPFKKPEEVIENFNKIHEKMKPNLAKLFDLVPKTPFEVRRTEAFREKSASAEYNQGSMDGTRPGIFYVPIPDVTQYNMYSDEDLFLHEAIPGHHYQISLQQENQNLPEFRKTLWYSAYGEGWALYTESLGKELGLYEDPYQYFGMLGAEMHRAIRLVVDAGMHAKGWTREQAIQYSLDNEAESEESIIAEIERYMAGPGQALSYKIGQLKIRELRTKAEQELGEKFDIKVFHNKVLESGCIPLKLLENKINTWIQEEKNKTV